ncbi:enoyl-ACP reductase [Pseudorhodoferax sp. Leaf274]|uniref:enoyl-ACP reductase FabI n=1 Tax=Pseudorhodoferax sp. Leaf274 TaxID=1736318 RepID=UPI0007031673|nr:enoyl-ACP reductase [Pseudorhodoferax sp. Leaf274]KQP41153.1 enoyl-ACP reductase [Pseudorhodoferax sp. Leaf274]
MKMLDRRRVLIMGLLNKRSIAYGIAAACKREGAELAFSYQTEAIRERIAPIAAELGSELLVRCDVADDTQIAEAFEDLARTWPTLDGVVHALAFAPLASLAGDFLESADREAFRVAHDISAYSLVAATKRALPMLAPGASIVTISFLGAKQAVPFYNMMGLAKAALESAVRYLAASVGPRQVRVNAISAGPIRTASSLAISNFAASAEIVARDAPLRRNVTIEEVGETAAFLLSPRASGITGNIVHVDAGFHAIVPGLSGMQAARTA